MSWWRPLQGLPGPLFWFELVRTARGGRHVHFRLLYAGLLLATLFFFYVTWFTGPAGNPWDLFSERALPPSEVARFAENFFTTFVWTQFLAAVLFTPACTAGAIAEERERGSLDLLLTTHLTDPEIVLAKYAARVANLVLLFLTSLPILSFMQLLGGIDPNLMMLAYLHTGLAILALASLSILNSIYAANHFEAIWRTYLWAFGFLGCCGLSLLNVDPDSHRVLMVANGLGYLLVAMTCTIWAVQGFRREARGAAGSRDGSSPPRFSAADGASSPYVAVCRPAVWDSAVLWKELHTGVRLGTTGLSPVVLFALLAMGLPIVIHFIIGCVDCLTSGREVSEYANPWVRVIGCILATLALLGISVHAAGLISRERERHTLDSLLLTRLETTDILLAKGWASILSMREIWVVLLAIWCLGTISTGLDPLAFPCLLIAWVVHAAFVVSLGLWLSASKPTTLQATVWVLLIVLVLSGGPPLVGNDVGTIGSGWLPDGVADAIWRFKRYGLSPPVALGTLMFSSAELNPTRNDHARENILAALAGIPFYLVASWTLWTAAERRLDRFRGAR